ncbi:MAG: HEPN domain-containing protein [Dehalococcoidales bacterium]|nr:HEPN domain-containing protein [Dehalococcoidales bacterium]
MNNNLNEAQRWLSQAEADLKVARWDFEGEFWWEVCFKCQQAVEKALKSYCYARGDRAILTHSLVEIGRRCLKNEPAFSDHIATFKKLDKYYIVTRYPNGLPGLTPADYFDKDEASQSLDLASRVLDFVKQKLEALNQE